MLTDLANALRDEGEIDKSECFIVRHVRIDEGRWRADWTDAARKRRKDHGDRGSARLAALGQHAANHHEVTLVQLSFEFYMIEAKPQNLIGDRAHDSDQLDEQMRSRFSEQLVSRVLRETEAGVPVADLYRKLGISEATIGAARNRQSLGLNGPKDGEVSGDNCAAFFPEINGPKTGPVSYWAA